jgi:ubiquinone/menaquinone biosynthesis C-methylase UbiE
MIFKTAVNLSHFLITNKINKGDTVVDATIGNGNDTLLLAKLVGPQGKVYGFDIREDAIRATRELLIKHSQFEQTELHLRSHAELSEIIHKPISAAMFNLGFLPGNENRQTTKAETTIDALKQLLRLLLPGGIITVVVYLKHDSGRESAALERFLQEIPQQEFNIVKSSFINQVNEPPYLITIEKI